jgi:hypothetical protein
MGSGGPMLTIEQIVDKTYTPRDLWESLERITQLEAAIQAHKWAHENIASVEDNKLYEVLLRKIEKL